MSSMLFLGRSDDFYTDQALEFCKRHFDVIEIYRGDWNSKYPSKIDEWEGDYIVSYLSRWIIPAKVLARASKCAINFHPAPPKYPGFGGVNWAIYNEDYNFGVTAHLMEPVVDSGMIIKSRTFPIIGLDTINDVLGATYPHLLALFYEVMTDIIQGLDPKPSAYADKWGSKTHTRNELNDLSVIDLGNASKWIDSGKLVKQINATTYMKWSPVVKIGDFIFELVRRG
jgi:methionyl-tRNA formyltransferase